MSGRGLDYAGGIPRAAAVKAAGYVGVLRYLKKRGSSSVHVLTAAEYADMKAHRIGVALIYEDTDSTRMAGGSSAGVTDADWALRQARALGITPRCIYFAADWDVQPSQYGAVSAYLNGAASVLGRAKVGFYGGYNAITHCGSHASWRWQTMAWSGGRTAAGIHVRQRLQQTTVDGVSCDVNDLIASDYGQHPATKELPEMLIARPTTPGTFLLVSGAGVTILRDSESVSALVRAGVPEATLSDRDFSRLHALVK